MKVTTLTTDLYQLTMAYAYWKSGKHETPAVFDYFYRKCPFDGEFAIFAGLAELMDFVRDFKFSHEDIEYLRTGPLAGSEAEFFEWLRGVDFSGVKIYAAPEGSVVFPRVPPVRVEGPLAIAQLLETPLLAALNFPSLVTTNAARYRMAAGDDKVLLEFGLRRAQDGMRASHYAWIGGFDGTSNVQAAKDLGIGPRGTMAHSFVSSFTDLSELKSSMLKGANGVEGDFARVVGDYRAKLGYTGTNEGELAAFVAYAQAFPQAFLALVDTYDTLRSGVPNFICVALALRQFGYTARGIRIDSGDLAYLSREAKRMFIDADARAGLSYLAYLPIGASNDINEKILWSLREQEHAITLMGIGTAIATCDPQPSFGGVYKLVSIAGKSKIKLSNDTGKVSIPGRKDAYRLVGADGKAILDLMVEAGAPAPKAGERVLARHPFNETKRAYVTPASVIPLYQLVWDNGSAAKLPTRSEVRERVKAQLALMREDHLRRVNPTPYKISVSDELYRYMHDLWQEEAPIAELR